MKEIIALRSHRCYPMSMEILLPHYHAIDPNFTVNRVLPTVKKRTVGPFVFWDHMGPLALQRGDELAVRPHPHIGIATITFLFQGAILHRDSLGFSQAILPGEVNWMMAGRGISHSERTGPLDPMQRGKLLEGIQAWVALPEEEEDAPPAFYHFANKELPQVSGGSVSLTLIAGQSQGERSPVPYGGDIFYLNGELKRGDSAALPIEDFQEGAIYVAAGEVELESGAILDKGHMAWRKGGKLFCRATSEEARVLFLGGRPLSKPRHMWWNFVHSSKQKIEEAKASWQQGRFPMVPGESEWIPLPPQ